jgi:YcxB-like protein
MPEASGDFRFGAAQPAARPLARRMFADTGLARYGLAIFLGVALAGLWGLAAFGVRLAHGRDALASGAVTTLILVVWGFALVIGYGQWRMWTISRIWLSRGMTNPFAMSYVVDESGLTVRQPGQETHVAWSAVTEVAPARKHWLLMANMDAYAVPKAFFADADAEHAFIAEAVRRLSPAALARSPEAIAFAGD